MDRYSINLVGAGEQREWDSEAERFRPPASNRGHERRQENSSRSLILCATV
jgi:hypothetical protein